MAIAMRTLSLDTFRPMRPLDRPELGKKLTELRNRYRWSQAALADAAECSPPTIAAIENGYGQRELDKWKDDPTYSPKPYKTHPDTLREIAHALAKDRSLEEKESVYAELVTAAGWAPTTGWLPTNPDPESDARRWEQKEAEMQRRYDERVERTTKLLEEIWRTTESA